MAKTKSRDGLGLARSLCSQSSLRAVKKQAAKLAKMLDENGLVLFSGGCRDFAVIIHRETGILLGSENTSVWMGGDLNAYEKDGVEYCPSISPTAGDFSSANTESRHGRSGPLSGATGSASEITP